jgi:PadR family transcriptional regulator, regulatory protein PadR
MAQKPPPRLELLRGTLDLLILRTLLPGPSHGHAIAKHIQRTSEDLLQVETGSLYPALYRLERQGLIRSEWRTTENNRRARYYALTAAGRRQLTHELENWERLSRAINLVLQAQVR